MYFSRPNGEVRLRSLFCMDANHSDPLVPTADEWISRRVLNNTTANVQSGRATHAGGLGTEHTGEHTGTVAA